MNAYLSSIFKITLIVKIDKAQQAPRYIEGAETEPTGRTLHHVLGVEQHPSTQLWQVWVSRTGTDLHVVSAHREREAADATIAEIKRVAALGELFDEEEVVDIVGPPARSRRQ